MKSVDKAVHMRWEAIAGRIMTLRRYRVIIDTDLAELYGVETKRLNEQVKRNIDRFPADFMFQLTRDEKAEVVANCDHLQRLKFSPTPPLAFTEHGTLMAASILNTSRAVEVSVYVVRAFVKLRELLATDKDLAQRMSRAEQRLSGHDRAIGGLIEVVHQLSSPPAPGRKHPIGFVRPKDPR